MVMKKLDINEVRDFIQSHSDETKVYIGGDSRRFRKDGMWHAEYTMAIVVHIDGKHGCKIFGESSVELDYDQKRERPSMRLMNEVYKISELYLKLHEVLEDKIVEVHLDINPNEAYGSSCVVQQAIGYIRGVCNVIPMVKPQAFAASYAADRLKEVLAA
jgi:predicted RNase H-related nuclease YkuK (DUF458 family)